MSEVLDCFVIRNALQAAGIHASVPALDMRGVNTGEWIAVVNVDEDFGDESAVRAVFDMLGMRVEWISHDLYSRFNHTAGGVDLGGGKTWNVIFAPSSEPLMEDRIESPAQSGETP